jgi:transcription elongation factor GreB
VSKAFTKEDGGDGGVVIPARAPLPEGVPNYVTPRGMALLRAELAALEEERAGLDHGDTAGDAGTRDGTGGGGDDGERRRRLAIVGARLGALAARIGGAVVVEAAGQPPGEVRFGATVTLRRTGGAQAGAVRLFTIVGVDEASAAEGRIAFVAPIARAVLGRRVGDTVTVRAGRGDEEAEIVAVAYGG